MSDPSVFPAGELASWSRADWKAYGDDVCNAFTAKVQQCLDSAQAAQADEQHDHEQDDDHEGVPQLSGADETELALIIGAYTRSVTEFIDERRQLSVGMDEAVVLALSSLSRVCHHVVSHSDLLTVDGQIALLELFPDIATLSEQQLSLWLQHQQAKVATLVQRVVSSHSMQAASCDVDAATPFAGSVLDLFTILSATATGYFEHLSRLAPHGLSTFAAFLLLLDDSIRHYSRAVVRGCGSVHSLVPRGDDDFKLKQSDEQEPSLLKKKAATIKSYTAGLRLAVVEHAAKSSVEKAVEEMSERSVVDADSPSSVASHSIEELCVHVSSVQACIDMMAELQTQIRGAWSTLCKQRPNVKQAAQRMRDSAQQDDDADNGERKAQPREQKQHSKEQQQSAAKLLLLSSVGHHLFPSASAQLYEDRKVVCELLSVAVVFIDWRRQVLIELYNPSAADSPRVVGGALLDAVNARMPFLYSHLQRSLFPILCEHLLRNLCTALSFVIVYGRRVIEQEDVQSILLPDILAVELLFADELSALTVESCCHDYRRLLGVVAMSTEALLSTYANYDSKSANFPVSRVVIARILGLRRGSLVGNFIKTERRKQKEKESSSSSRSANSLEHHLQLQVSKGDGGLPSSSSFGSQSHSPSNPFAADGDDEEAAHHDDDFLLVSHPPPTSSVPISELLATNSSRYASSSASSSLRNTQRALSAGLSSGLRKSKMASRALYGKLKAKPPRSSPDT